MKNKKERKKYIPPRIVPLIGENAYCECTPMGMAPSSVCTDGTAAGPAPCGLGILAVDCPVGSSAVSDNCVSGTGAPGACFDGT